MRIVFDITPQNAVVGVVVVVATILFFVFFRTRSAKKKEQAKKQDALPHPSSTTQLEREELEGQETEADAEEDLNNNTHTSERGGKDHPISHEDYGHIPFIHHRLSVEESVARSEQFYQHMNTRRSVRMFSQEEVPIEIIEKAILTAGTSPSGAHKQPWTFVVVKDAKVKTQIREAAEKEEKYNYEKRMSETWKDDLKPLGTNWEKPHLEDAPYLIVVFKQQYGITPNGQRDTHYYQEKSVGIAVGFLIAAIHNAGLVTLTHTPTPMGFLSKVLNRPVNEKPFILLPVGYPAKDATVPDLQRKSLEEIMVLV